MLKILLFLASCLIYQSYAGKTVDSHLTGSDLERFQKVFADGVKSSDLQSVYYAAINYEKITAPERQASCGRLESLYKESKLNEFEKNFYWVGSHKALKCTTELPKNVLSTISTSLSKDSSTAQEIFFNLFASKTLGNQIDKTVADKLAKTLQNILKKDDSLSNLGYAFYIAAELGAPAAFVVDRVEDAIVQADEVDGKMLQFEGGLSITALIVNGAFKVTKANNKPSPISADQAVKLANYFLTRRSVQSSKGAHVLIEALKSIASDKKISPICIQVLGNGQLQADAATLNIKVVDLLGASVIPPPASISGKVVSKQGNTVLAEKVIFASRSSDKTVFSADLSIYKPARGIYTVNVAADNYAQSLNFKVLGKVKVHALEIGVGDSDAASAIKKQTVHFPSKLSETLSADHTQKIVLKVSLTDESTSKVISVHQAFVRLANKKSDEEIIFVAEQDTTKAYKFDMDVGSHSGDFGHISGLYTLELIIGDASLSNSFRWHAADIQLSFAREPKTEHSSSDVSRSPLPEISHQFREPEKRPPRFVSDVFTGLCLTPLVLLLILWAKLRINVSAFSFSLSGLGFHLGFGAILTLFGIFWLQLNMFDTVRYLLPIAIFTFLCGNRLLRSIAAQKPAATQ